MKSEDYKRFEKEFLKDLKVKLCKFAFLKNNENLNDKMRQDYTNLKKELRLLGSACNSLTKIEVSILQKYYVDCKTMQIVADEVGYSTYYCSRIKVKAIKKLLYLIEGVEN